MSNRIFIWNYFQSLYWNFIFYRNLFIFIHKFLINFIRIFVGIYLYFFTGNFRILNHLSIISKRKGLHKSYKYSQIDLFEKHFESCFMSCIHRCQNVICIHI